MKLKEKGLFWKKEVHSKNKNSKHKVKMKASNFIYKTTFSNTQQLVKILNEWNLKSIYLSQPSNFQPCSRRDLEYENIGTAQSPPSWKTFNWINIKSKTYIITEKCVVFGWFFGSARLAGHWRVWLSNSSRDWSPITVYICQLITRSVLSPVHRSTNPTFPPLTLYNNGMVRFTFIWSRLRQPDKAVKAATHFGNHNTVCPRSLDPF